MYLNRDYLLIKFVKNFNLLEQLIDFQVLLQQQIFVIQDHLLMMIDS